MKRRTVLASAAATIGSGGCLWFRGDSCEIACFEFIHQEFDDAPDWVTITHTAGRDLPAEEVFITDVTVEHGRTTDEVIKTIAWHEVDDEIGGSFNDDEIAPSDTIAGESVRIDYTLGIVKVLWRDGSGERVLDEFQLD